jgi:hypothetical protein
MNETKRIEQPTEQPPPDNSPMALLRMAVEQDRDISIVEKLMDLKERYDANEAKKAYWEAMTRFRGECPEVVKTRVVDFTSAKGRTHYRHAGLAETLQTIRKRLADCQLSVAWHTEQPEANSVRVICEVTHRAGHTESTSICLPYDNSGNKNPLQAIGSATTYGERYTLFSLLGLAALDEDDDGAAAFDADAKGPITEGEATVIEELIDKSGTNRKKFLAWLQTQGIDGVENIPTGRFQYVRDMLQKKIDKKEVA